MLIDFIAVVLFATGVWALYMGPRLAFQKRERRLADGRIYTAVGAIEVALAIQVYVSRHIGANLLLMILAAVASWWVWGRNMKRQVERELERRRGSNFHAL